MASRSIFVAGGLLVVLGLIMIALPNRGYRADNMTGSVPGSRRWMSTLSYLDLES
jgi:hypothetical protein